MKNIMVVLKILTFLVIFVVLVLLLGKALNYNVLYMYDPAYKISKNSIDGVICGSSVMECAMLYMDIYHNTGIKLLPEAVSAQRMETTYYKLKNIFKGQSPKVLIIDLYLVGKGRENISNYHFSLDSMKFGIDKISNAFTVSNSLGECMELTFPLIAYHSNWKKVAMLEDKRKEYNYYKSEDFLIESSYIYSFSKVSKEEKNLGFTYMQGLSFDETAGNEILNSYMERHIDSTHLFKIVDLAKKNNCKIIFTELPKYNNDWEINNFELVRSYYKDDKDIYFINFTSLINEIGLCYNDDMRDVTHMNYLGAKKITKYMIKYLNENFVFEKNDVDKKLWDESYVKYLQKMKEKMDSGYENDIGTFDEVFTEYYLYDN